MRVGTRSVLYGAHAFWLHPWFVAEAWSRLYGFPWRPWLWVMFFVHDIGYLGKPNMDGEEGERHPRVGAEILWWLESGWDYVTFLPSRCPAEFKPFARRSSWGHESLFHSRFLAKKHGHKPSRLCMADKLAISLTPWWLYLPMTIATGEIREYMGLAKTDRHSHEHAQVRSDVKDSHPAVRLFGIRGRWYLEVQQYVREWVEEHKDGREDTWTRKVREARTESGVWS